MTDAIYKTVHLKNIFGLNNPYKKAPTGRWGFFNDCILYIWWFVVGYVLNFSFYSFLSSIKKHPDRLIRVFLGIMSWR